MRMRYAATFATPSVIRKQWQSTSYHAYDVPDSSVLTRSVGEGRQFGGRKRTPNHHSRHAALSDRAVVHDDVR